MAGAYAQYTFNGTGITLVGGKEQNHGKADIYIDGTLDSTIDTYSSSILNQQTLYTKIGLANSSHTIKIIIRSDKNPAYSAFYTDINDFIVTS